MASGIAFSQDLLNTNNVISIMSRKGNCWDNARTESFFGSLKNEWIKEKYLKLLRIEKKIF